MSACFRIFNENIEIITLYYVWYTYGAFRSNGNVKYVNLMYLNRNGLFFLHIMIILTILVHLHSSKPTVPNWWSSVNPSKVVRGEKFIF